MNSFEIQYTKADLENAFNLHYAKQFPIRSKLLLILGILLFVVGIGLFIIHVDRLAHMKWLFFVIGLFYIGFYFYRKNSLIKLALKNPTIKDMRKMSFNDKQIRFEGDTGYAEQKWENFNEVYDNEDSILLYLSKHNFFIVPKRALSKEESKMLLNFASK